MTPDNGYDSNLDTNASEFLDEFGEDVTYLPEGGGSRSIVGIVVRKQPAAIDGASGAVSPMITVMVANDSTKGIGSEEIDTGGDKLAICPRIGKAAQQRRITKMTLQDHGMLRIEVR